MSPAATHLGRFVFPAGHPCLPGHFPGDPVAPGALLLDEAVSLLLSQGPGARLAQVVTFKFLSPVRPGDQVDVYRETVRSDTVTLCCAVAGVTALRGTLRLAVA